MSMLGIGVRVKHFGIALSLVMWPPFDDGRLAEAKLVLG
jgi:hypothetical protein